MTKIQRELADFALKVGAFRLVPDEPVRWASGFLMPVYTDNRLLLRFQSGRMRVREALLKTLGDATDRAGSPGETMGVNRWDGVAGTASAGIAPALLVAEALGIDFYYVRGAAKDHGLGRQIEGLGPGESMKGRRILLIEDLLSTGGSAASAAEALTTAGADVPLCLGIFTYGFSAVDDRFSSLPCDVRAVLSFQDLLEVGRTTGVVDREQAALLDRWRQDPFRWEGVSS